MGIFGDMRSIKKIYDLLAVLEKELVNYVGNAQSTSFIRDNRAFLASQEAQINNNLYELMSIVDKSGDTVKCADFLFMEEKHRIGQIIFGITKLMEQTKAQIRCFG